MVSDLSKIRGKLRRILYELSNVGIDVRDTELYRLAVTEINHAIVLLKLLEEREEEHMAEEEGFSEEEGFY
jgi:hypothetical protein